MGLCIENYSLSELHRISVPGAVAPTLFWALPVGDWGRGRLNSLWKCFTEQPGECRDLGLLLIKDSEGNSDSNTDFNLATVGAKLTALMPAGAENFVRSSAYRGEAPQLLVLSGGYPQPGWGVLIEWKEYDAKALVDLVRRAIDKMQASGSPAKLDVFANAAEAFRKCHELKERPAIPPELSRLKEVESIDQILGLLRDARTALEDGEEKMFEEKLLAARQNMPVTDWLDVREDVWISMLEMYCTMVAATAILGVTPDILADQVMPKLAEVSADADAQKSAFRGLTCPKAKAALRACLHLREEGIEPTGADIQDWAKEAKSRLTTAVKDALSDFLRELEGKHAQCIAQLDKLAMSAAKATKDWRMRSAEARALFHSLVGKAAEFQWEIGPRFLVAFESVCREESRWVRSIPWDPARMIGWKIMAAQIKVQAGDLQDLAAELAPDAPVAGLLLSGTEIVADGSYFTDYVHHIAISRPGYSPRAVTCDLVSRLLRPAEMRNLMQVYGSGQPEATPPAQLSEQLMQALGWHQRDQGFEKPLAASIRTGEGETCQLVKGMSGNDLRIMLESLCKDMVDVLVGKLGFAHQDVWDAMEEKAPDYIASSKDKDWDEEVRLLTVGAGLRIWRALAPLAFPDKEKHVAGFAEKLGELGRLLNNESHHRADHNDSLPPLAGAGPMVEQLLELARSLLGELPWHLEVGCMYGQQPAILSGEAWSHGHPTPRLLRVIVWTGETPGTRVMLWNKTRRNPIVTDPMFIGRPRRAP